MSKQTERKESIWFHFPATLIGALGVFSACVIGLAVTLGTYTPEDVLAYQKIVSGVDENDTTENVHASRQQRSGLQKDLLLTDKNSPLAVRLLSARSELALDQHAGHTNVIEYMEDVVCFMQEELLAFLPDGRKASKQPDGRFLIENMDPDLSEAWLAADAPQIQPMQLIRRLDAKAATYYYKDELFKAENVKVTRYFALGHDINKATFERQLLMKGIAQAVDFSLKGNDRNFRAHHLKATFYSPRKQ